MHDARLGVTIDGRYRLEERIAAGGMGVVYRASRLGLAKPVAIKFLHRSQATLANRRQRFEREAAAMSRLSHPNLVSVIDYGEYEDSPYLVMDYHQGESLRQLLDRGPLAPSRAVHLARQLLAGLDSAHASGVVHRDLKPQNVLLVGKPGEDLVKVLDFGVAKLLEGDSNGPSELSVMAGSLLGTAEYMAPEQVRCEAIDPRTDVYAVGVLLFEMLTGRRPFEAERDLAVLRMQVEEAPPSPRELAPHISAPLEAAVLRALEKDRAGRWASADEFSKNLGRTPEGRGGLRLPTSTPTAPVPPLEPEPEPDSQSGAEVAPAPAARRRPRPKLGKGAASDGRTTEPVRAIRRRIWPWLVAAAIVVLVGVWVAHELGVVHLPLPRLRGGR
jgi:eukaryotic-like serine/threonine-protein kinase